MIGLGNKILPPCPLDKYNFEKMYKWQFKMGNNSEAKHEWLKIFMLGIGWNNTYYRKVSARVIKLLKAKTIKIPNQGDPNISL